MVRKEPEDTHFKRREGKHQKKRLAWEVGVVAKLPLTTSGLILSLAKPTNIVMVSKKSPGCITLYVVDPRGKLLLITMKFCQIFVFFVFLFINKSLLSVHLYQRLRKRKTTLGNYKGVICCV